MCVVPRVQYCAAQAAAAVGTGCGLRLSQDIASSSIDACCNRCNGAVMTTLLFRSPVAWGFRGLHSCQPGTYCRGGAGRGLKVS